MLTSSLMSPEENAEMARTASEPEAFIMAESAIPSPGEPVMQELVFFPTAECYYDYKNKKYIYQYKDHLGNVRMSYYKNTAGLPIALDNNNYYPFGMNHLSSGGDAYYDPLNATPYNYKYNGKELQETGMYDYGWRMYMPDIARWNGIDQLVEKFNAASPYAYVMNNPISFFDQDGRDMGMPDWLKGLWGASPNGHSTYWSNTGDGFSENQWGRNVDFGGNFTNFNLFSANPNAGGSGSYYHGGYNDNLPVINVPGITLTGKSSGWGQQIQSQFNSFMDVINENGKAFANWDEINKKVGAFGFANELKIQSLEYSVRSNYKSARTAKEFNNLRPTQQSWRTKNTLGKVGANYLGVVKGLGTAIGVVGAIDAWRQQIEKPSPGNFIRAGVNTATLFMRVNPAVAIGLGIMDVTGASDYIYDNIDHALGH